MTKIGKYELTCEFTTSGGGQCQWAFAAYGDKEYFIKEFLSPTYPLPTAPGGPATKAKRLERCKQFEEHHNGIIKSLADLSKRGGNLIVAEDFFRFGARYYKVTVKVDVSSLSVDQVHNLPDRTRLVIALTVAHSLQILHRLDLVHGDLKPPNVLLKATGDSNYAAKLIDFDDAYFSGRPKPAEELVGDIVYYAPETHLYVLGEIEADALTCAVDIFALAILYCEYFTGARPNFEDALTCSAGVLNGQTYTTGLETSAPTLHNLIVLMLDRSPSRRPTISQVIASLKSIMRGGDGVLAPPAVEPPRETAPRLRGKGLSRTEVPEGTIADGPRLRGKLLDKGRESGAAGGASASSEHAPSRFMKKRRRTR